MSETDYQQYELFFQSHKLTDCFNNALLSPWHPQVELFEKYYCKPQVLGINDWDITQPARGKYDIVFATHVLCYIQEPKKAIENILNSCKWFLLQDIVIRYRNGEREFVDECMRFYHKELSVKSIFDGALDLSYLGDKICSFKQYNDNSEKNINFLTLIKGNL